MSTFTLTKVHFSEKLYLNLVTVGDDPLVTLS